MGFPIEIPQAAVAHLAENVARSRASQMDLRLRVGLFDESIAGREKYRRRLAVASEIADPHVRLAELLALGEELRPLLVPRTPFSVGSWLDWALVEFRTPHDDSADQAQEGGRP